jgi:hypothetical protein
LESAQVASDHGWLLRLVGREGFESSSAPLPGVENGNCDFEPPLSGLLLGVKTI